MAVYGLPEKLNQYTQTVPNLNPAWINGCKIVIAGGTPWGNVPSTVRNWALPSKFGTTVGGSGNPYVISSAGPALQLHPFTPGNTVQYVTFPTGLVGDTDGLTTLWFGFIDNIDGTNSYLWMRGTANDSWRTRFTSSTNIRVSYIDNAPAQYDCDLTIPTVAVGDIFTHVSAKSGNTVYSYFKSRAGSIVSSSRTAGTAVFRSGTNEMQLGYFGDTPGPQSHERLIIGACWNRCLSPGEITQLMLNPWQLFDDPFAAWYYTAASSGVSGTLASTLGNVTSAASGTTTVLGTLSQTLANTTSAASGTTTVTGTVGITLADTTLAASGSVGSPVSGTVTETLDDTTLSASGTTTVLGTTSQTLANTTLSAAGTTTVLGTVNNTLENTTLAASGSVGSAVSGSVSINLADVTLAASGNTTILGSVNRTLENTVLSAQGTTSVLGTLGVTLGNTTLVATGTSGSVTSGAAYRFLKLWLSKLGV